MTTIKSPAGERRTPLLRGGAAVLLGVAMTTVALSQPPPQVGTSQDSAHVFLNFSAGKSTAETPTTATNYMAAIDPGQKKLKFTDWLINAGFIGQASDWAPTGQQTYTHQTTAAAANPANDYGPGKINAFAHIIILNAADLGFIRNQYIRCKPDCLTRGAKVYTYLENYGGGQFASLRTDGSGGGDINTVQVNNAKSVSIALERRSGNNLGGNVPGTKNPFGAGGRIADVAFEWAPASNGTSPGTSFGQLYAYIVQPQLSNIKCLAPGLPTGTLVPDSNGNPTLDELYVWPSDSGANQAFWDCKFNNRPTPVATTDIDRIGFLNPHLDYAVHSNDPFAPELDALGTKQMPGVCLICHGGNIPSNLATNPLAWGPTGQIQEFRYLPADADNAIFGVNDTGSPLVTDLPGVVGSDMTRAAQEIELKKYNQAVAITQGALQPKNAVILADGTIGGGAWTVPTFKDGTITRPTHGLEVLFGWYAGFKGDLSMSASVQNGSFTPVGWQVTTEGANLYQSVIKPSCRSCHENREPSLDFGTQAQFDANKGNVQDWVFQPECDAQLGQINPRNIVMPLAKITWERFWNGIDPSSNIAFDVDSNGVNHTLSPTDPNSQINLLKAHFGYTPTSYCASHH